MSYFRKKESVPKLGRMGGGQAKTNSSQFNEMRLVEHYRQGGNFNKAWTNKQKDLWDKILMTREREFRKERSNARARNGKNKVVSNKTKALNYTNALNNYRKVFGSGMNAHF